ncbi:MAG: zinc-dependent metalloprotease [Bacteroidia bacterium]
MKNLLTIIPFLLVSTIIHAQQENLLCGTKIQSDAWENEFQKLISNNKNDEKGKSQISNNYIIPVVFHIIHGGEPIGTYPNILQDQIRSQLTILNQDFSGNSYNLTNYPSNAFANWAVSQNIPSENLDENGRIKIADLSIQFCLATQDTNGNLMPEPGIDRVNFLSMGLPAPNAYSTQIAMRTYLDSILKPQTIWDVTKYLNVWITDKNNALSYAGVSSLPPLSGLSDLTTNTTELTDGIWCFTKAIGSYTLFPAGSYISAFIDGRTLTHEVGHYLGLRHIWGDVDCGNDFCDDTPPAAGQNTGTPVYPHNAGSCDSPSNNPDGEMFMNFMDYTRGPSKYMFTTDQKTRVHTAMQNSPFRNQLGTHGLCSTTNGLNYETFKNNVSMYPNPAINQLNVNVAQFDIDEISISNLLGQVLIKTINKNTIDIYSLTSGIYIITITQGQNKYSQKFIKE